MRIGVIVGRFQPLHKQHLAVLIEPALAENDLVIIVCGSAQESRTRRNPFNKEERGQILRETLLALKSSTPFEIVFADDKNDMSAWVKQIQAFPMRWLESSAQYRINIYGSDKDSSTFYLQHFPEWQIKHVHATTPINANDIRDAIFNSKEDVVPPSAEQWLHPATISVINKLLQNPQHFKEQVNEMVAQATD